MSFVNLIPAILRVIIVFLLILLAIRKSLSLGNAFVAGGFLLALLFAMPVASIADSVGHAVSDLKTVSLSVIVVLILVLSRSMDAAGQMHRLLTAFRGLIASPRLNLMVFPALIGLLPMPGGSVFSAPMVKELGRQSDLEPHHLSFINYWFRHIWEYWWPMYPGVLLATLMADINLAGYIAAMLPLTAMAVYLGWHPIKPAISPATTDTREQRQPRLFVRELMPILIAIVPGLVSGSALTVFFPGFSVAKETGLILALLAAVAWVCYQNHLSARRIQHLVFSGKLLKMLYMVISILIFKQLLTDSGAVVQIAGEMTRWRIPLFLVAAILPFIVGTIAGVTVAFVGTTLPIIIPLVHAQGHGDLMMAYIMLCMVFGFIGVLISPLHLCLTLSNQYFDIGPSSVYRLLKWPCIGLALMGTAYFWGMFLFFRLL